MNKTLVVMIKEPRPGRVKTRLGRDIGMVSSAWWFRHQSADLLRRLRDPRWRVVLATAPDTAVSSRVWPADLDRIPQGNGDLGQRMTRMLKTAANTGPVCLIGADIPGIQRVHIARAFGALGHHDAVFGPAPDGGFWLVGARHPKRLPRGAFEGARWSSVYALSDSLNTLHGQRIALVDTLADVDTVENLRAVQG